MRDDIVVCSLVRTPVGADGGQFASVEAADLAAAAIEGLLERTGLAPDAVDDVILGQAYPNGESPAIGRVAALNAGLPVETAGIQIDRRCGSGIQSVLYAGLTVQEGWADVVIAGGAESMSQGEFYMLGAREGTRKDSIELVSRIARGRVTAGGRNHPVPGGMVETAENVRREYGITREDQDAYAAMSQAKALAAREAGRFDDEIVPVTVPGRHKAPAQVLMTDEHPREGVTPESLARLTPVRSRVDDEATVTAGNACGQSDGAAVGVVTTRRRAEQLGLRPMVRIVASAVVGVPPRVMGIGPIPAVERVLARSGLTMADMDLIELNEAFASQVLACARAWDLTDADIRERFNVNGSGISLGHPAGATGARILTTLAHELHRREGRYGLETMCIGGGQGLAVVVERVPA